MYGRKASEVIFFMVVGEKGAENGKLMMASSNIFSTNRLVNCTDSLISSAKGQVRDLAVL